DWKDRLIGGIGGLELAGFTVEHGSSFRCHSHPLDDALAEQALRPEQQERESDEVRQPAVDAAAQQVAPVKLADLFAHADDEPADNGAGNRGKAAEDEHRQSPEGDDL